jgi:hypothetical protein
MADLNTLCVSITEVEVSRVAELIKARRFQRRKAWTESTEKYFKKKAKKGAAKKSKTRKARKPPSLDSLVASMTAEQKAALIASYSGGTK